MIFGVNWWDVCRDICNIVTFFGAGFSVCRNIRVVEPVFGAGCDVDDRRRVLGSRKEEKENKKGERNCLFLGEKRGIVRFRWIFFRSF